jgi:hypothetical protein
MCYQGVREDTATEYGDYRDERTLSQPINVDSVVVCTPLSATSAVSLIVSGRLQAACLTYF